MAVHCVFSSVATKNILVFLKNMIPIPAAYVDTSQSKLEQT